ncbi:MAG: class I SAM-dependent methyltransferase [Chitinophagaceae bacterium]|nr:class I SAM-dependent methyltransferase [Chitinophagaceae bacterium]
MEQRKPGAERLSRLKLSLNSTDYLVYKYLFRDLKYAISKYAGEDVLDVGCGNKPYSSFFPEVNSYTGCDVVQSSQKLVDVICPATSLAFPDQHFKTVFSTQVLEHVDDHQKAFAEIYRVLKPGGYFIFSVPFTWELHEEPYDYFRFTKYGIDFLMSKYGFEKVEILANGGKWAAVGQLRVSMIWSRFRNKPRLSTIYKLFVKYCGIRIVLNSFYSLMDRLEYDELITLNYVCVARKPANMFNASII